MRIVDLFCGCGGLSLGALDAGFAASLSVDVDPILTGSYAINFPRANLVLADVAQLSGDDLRRLAGDAVDGIVGGPPCQGFSEVGLARLDDPRRELLWHFFRLVREAKPRFFLMENVRGLSFPKNRAVLDAALSLVAGDYDILGPIKLDAASFGAATSRPRVFVIGVDRMHVDPLRAEDLAALSGSPATVRDAIEDLGTSVRLLDATDGFDWWRHSRSAQVSPYARRLRLGERVFTGHRRTPHAPDVARRFASVLPGKKDPVGRHARLDWSGRCPTLRAGTGPEHGSFQAVRPLHPDEPRVITVREAARLQGFPDRFLFHPTVWHSFRMIGNSVSPIAAAAILGAVRDRMALPSTAVAAE